MKTPIIYLTCYYYHIQRKYTLKTGSLFQPTLIFWVVIMIIQRTLLHSWQLLRSVLCQLRSQTITQFAIEFQRNWFPVEKGYRRHVACIAEQNDLQAERGMFESKCERSSLPSSTSQRSPERFRGRTCTDGTKTGQRNDTTGYFPRYFYEANEGS